MISVQDVCLALLITVGVIFLVLSIFETYRGLKRRKEFRIEYKKPPVNHIDEDGLITNRNIEYLADFRGRKVSIVFIKGDEIECIIKSFAAEGMICQDFFKEKTFWVNLKLVAKIDLLES